MSLPDANNVSSGWGSIPRTTTYNVFEVPMSSFSAVDKTKITQIRLYPQPAQPESVIIIISITFSSVRSLIIPMFGLVYTHLHTTFWRNTAQFCQMRKNHELR